MLGFRENIVGNGRLVDKVELIQTGYHQEGLWKPATVFMIQLFYVYINQMYH